MNKLLFGVAIFLLGCSGDSQMFEGTNSTSAHSRQDGVFLRSYWMLPATPYLPIQEVFVEQRFMTGSHPARIRLLDSTTVEANLVVVLTKPLQLGTGSVNWDMELVEGDSLNNQQNVISCSQPGPKLLRFTLSARKRFDNPSFKLHLRFLKDYGTKVGKTVVLRAIPL